MMAHWLSKAARYTKAARYIAVFMAVLALGSCFDPDPVEDGNNEQVTTTPGKQPLNLNVPPDTATANDTGGDYDRPDTLPEMFTSQEKKKSGVKLDLVRDEKNPDYLDSIKGGTVSIEVEVPQSRKPPKPVTTAEAPEEKAP